jgi:hypothetical protein
MHAAKIGCQREDEAAYQPEEIDDSLGKMVSLNFGSWNQIGLWLRRCDRLRSSAVSAH